MDLRFRMP